MTILENYLRKTIDELDKTLAYMGLLTAPILTLLIIIHIDRTIFVIVPIITFFACAVYLFIRRKLSISTIPSLDQLSASPRFYIVLNTLFCLLLSYSILSIYFSPEPHTRPLGYFVFTALMAAIVAVEILFLSSGKLNTYLGLFKIMIIGLSLRWSQQLIFPSLVGVDPWMHEMFTLKILDTGYIPDWGYAYSRMPVFHLFSGITMLITNLDYRMAVMFSISLLHVLSSTLFIFLLGRFILGHKVGLLAALLMAVANLHIQFGFWPIPNTVATILILPILYLLFKMRKEAPVIFVSLTLLFMITLILTHALALWLAILLFAFWMGGKIYDMLYHERSFMPVTLGIVSLFTVSMFGYWMYITGHLTSLAIFIREGFIEDLFIVRHGPLAEEVARQQLLVPFLEQLFNTIGLFLFFALSFIGCFYIVSKKFSNIYGFVFAIGGGTILVISFIPMLTEQNIVEGRWHFFLQILLAIPLAVALLLLCQIFKQSLTKAGLMSSMVFLLAFFMIMSPVANIDNHLFSPNTVVRYALIESELKAIDTILDIWDGDYIGADHHVYWPFFFAFPPIFDGEVIHIDESLFAGDFRDHHDMLIIIRKEIVNRPFQVGLVGNIRLNHDPRLILTEQGFSRIYDSRSVSAFVKP